MADPISVSEAVASAKAGVAALGTLTVTGEVSGFRGPNARSGHCYFQVKDAAAAMDAIVWRGVYASSGVRLRDGLQVQLIGSFDVYAGTGRLSFVAKRIAVAGEGLLRQQVAELARRLEREGLMDSARKRPIPRFCERVVVVTSLSGSVIDDVRRTLSRRNPLVALQVVGCMVQGQGAPESIMRALRVAAGVHPDAILLVRGGGSFEDLMAFNDERLARAVAACPTPVVTGIGHEPDTSICDMVADRRCSTPTAAAESVAPSFDEVADQIEARGRRLVGALVSQVEREGMATGSLGDRMLRAIRSDLGRRAISLGSLAQRPCLSSPFAPLEERERAIELSAERLHGAMPRLLGRFDDVAANLQVRLVAAAGQIGHAQQRECERLSRDLTTGLGHLADPYHSLLARMATALDALSPLRVLGRGYAIAYDEGRHVVSNVVDVPIGSTLYVRLSSGELSACVTDAKASDVVP